VGDRFEGGVVNASAVLAATLLGSLCVSIAAGPQGQASAISVLGCLDRQQPHDFFLSDEEGNLYTLTGVTSDLIKHVGEEIRIEGTRDESTKPLPSLHVIGFQQVFTAPSPSLSSSFTNTAAWRTDRNQAYGLKFSHPESFPNSKAAVSANFPDDDGTATLGSFEMPSEIYAGTNFVGGSFTLSVSPKITNRASCKQFGTFDPKYLSSATENGIEYAVSTELSAAAGTAYTYYYFHAFQNGLCYEAAFDFGEFNTRNRDLGCRVASLSDRDEWNVIRPLIRAVSFVPPALPQIHPVRTPFPK
jgi:hypothetical protein